LYSKTLESYEQFFGHIPPIDTPKKNARCFSKRSKP